MKVKDLVCGMTIEEREAAGTSEYEGTTYHFCSIACKKKFDKDPGVYIAAGTGKKEKAA
jgi:YHS domain-containing protein